MLLTPLELAIIKPALALLAAWPHSNVILSVVAPQAPGHPARSVTMDIGVSGIVVKAIYPDSCPMIEYYHTPQGLAQAYGIPMVRVLAEAD